MRIYLGTRKFHTKGAPLLLFLFFASLNTPLSLSLLSIARRLRRFRFLGRQEVEGAAKNSPASFAARKASLVASTPAGPSPAAVSTMAFPRSSTIVETATRPHHVARLACRAAHRQGAPLAARTPRLRRFFAPTPPPPPPPPPLLLLLLLLLLPFIPIFFFFFFVDDDATTLGLLSAAARRLLRLRLLGGRGVVGCALLCSPSRTLRCCMADDTCRFRASTSTLLSPTALQPQHGVLKVDVP